jgi:aminoglycoside phosphotransferase (APT) family kinase protein
MATIGHPLSDLANLLNPYVLAINPQGPNGHPDFVPGATPGLPTEEQAINWYAEVARWNPAPDMTWGAAFGMLRSCVIMQGIAARYALRQASSANARSYAEMMIPFGELAWSLVEKAKDSGGPKPRL